MPETITDELLLKRAGKGDQEAFLELYERHRRPIFRFSYRILGSIELAEDVTHDCFLGLLTKPGNFNSERGSLKTYLFSAARNLAMKHFRNVNRESSMEDMVEEPQIPMRQQPLRQLLDEELVLQVRDAVFQLSPLQREALVLFEYEDLTLNEIADVVGADTGAVKARIYRAREQLKRLLRPYLNSTQELNSGREIVTLKEA